MAKRGLHTIKAGKGTRATKKRVGRGDSSSGTFAGRGKKGQKSRAGASGSKLRGIRQVMLATPKLRGFKSPQDKLANVNLQDLNEVFADGAIVTPKTLLQKELISSIGRGVKILAKGEIKKKLTIKNCTASAKAKELIEAAGGTFA